MKRLFLVFVSAGLLSIACIQATKNKPVATLNSNLGKGEYARVAVLELFTSEGCSSCPPADNLLPVLARLDEAVIPLSFHVDYWNRLGWKDPFSSALYSERQREYAKQFKNESVYTPQLVVNGQDEMVGSNRSRAEAAIRDAIKEKSSVLIMIDEVKVSGNTITISSHAKGAFDKQELEGFLVQPSATMDIKAGENKGARLQHTNIVRAMSSQVLQEKNRITLVFPVDLDPNDWKIVLLSRNRNDLKITGAAIYLPKK